MKKWISYYFWFIKESFSFMRGYNKVWILFNSIAKGFSFASNSCAYDKLTAQQKEDWYASREGRVMEF